MKSSKTMVDNPTQKGGSMNLEKENSFLKTKCEQKKHLLNILYFLSMIIILYYLKVKRYILQTN